ncbi:hypothetical protein BJV77DRAFT_531483 [Russula vinacea]|nr:hypothetical protein BJV77DRAFT_531483 [Russula vinacea]
MQQWQRSVAVLMALIITLGQQRSVFFLSGACLPRIGLSNKCCQECREITSQFEKKYTYIR